MTQKQKNQKKKRRTKSVSRRNLKKSLRFLPFIIPLILTAFIYMWQHTRMNIISISIENLRTKRQNLAKQNDSIRLRIETLHSLARIEAIARDELGMISPEKRHVIVLDASVRPPGRIIEKTQATNEEVASGRRAPGLVELLRRHGSSGTALRETSSTETDHQPG
jgi:cell division protein FtsL